MDEHARRQIKYTSSQSAPGIPGRWKHSVHASILEPITVQAVMGPPKPECFYPPASLPGGYSVGVPPDPIPNSAVKPDCANGTIAQAMEE